jgi:hypothetical protein
MYAHALFFLELIFPKYIFSNTLDIKYKSPWIFESVLIRVLDEETKIFFCF